MEKKNFKIPNVFYIILYFVFLQIPFYAKIAITLVAAIFAFFDYKKSNILLSEILSVSNFARIFIAFFSYTLLDIFDRLEEPMNIVLILGIVALFFLLAINSYKNGSSDLVTQTGHSYIKIGGLKYSKNFKRKCNNHSWIASVQPFPKSVKRIINAEGKSTKISIEITQETGTVNLLIKNKKSVLLDKKMIKTATFDIEVNEPVTVKFYTNTFEKFVGGFSVNW